MSGPATINAFEEKKAGPAQAAPPATAGISIITEADCPPNLRDVIACKALGGDEYRIGLKCKTDGPLRGYEADEMAEKVAKEMFRMGKVGFDTNRHIVWEESIKHFVCVFKVSQS